MIMIADELLHTMPGFFGILDASSRFSIVNEQGAKILGYRSAAAMAGETYANMPCKAAEEADFFLHMDKLAQSNGHIRFLGYYCYAADNWKIILGEKYSINSATIQIVSHFTDITHYKLLDLYPFFLERTGCRALKKQFCFLLNDHYFDCQLRPREAECLFLLLRGKCTKSIAQVLTISPRTVEDHLEKLKVKFMVTTKAQLIEKAIAKGYMNIIPSSFLP